MTKNNTKPKPKPKKKSMREKLWLPPIDINELSREMDMDDTPPNYNNLTYWCPYCNSVNVTLGDDGWCHCNDCGRIYNIHDVKQ